ncbi:alpha/beta fold hydrolase [Caulobacter sp. RHG1]|uniref:alpha/beta fold hydrolase n=1 Tax=Caulobacter sp. (strain RHG1) TaxID=2545762 RepID=UPI00155724AF|nr:alpha/beta hydrolase [Caulobacter sp. RHG1]NQE62234.1 Hydrolase, alpha/beta fold family [Caulobacter sp. RHG1]
MSKLTRGLLIGLGVVVVLLVGGWFLLQRPDIPYATLEQRYGHADSRYMDLPSGVRAHYRDIGPRDAPAIVLVHGFSASTHAWDGWIAALAKDYRVVVLDLPGHGLTRGPLVGGRDGFEAVVDGVTRGLGLSRFTLGGNSMGGGVAWAYTLDHSDRVERLLLVDSAGWPAEKASGAAIFSVMRTPVGRALLKDIDTRPLIAQGLRAAYLDPKLVTPALIDRYADLARAPGHRDILLSLQTGPRREAKAADLSRIHVPTLILFGQDDRLIPAADGEKFHKAIPGATLIIYPGVGHVPMEQIPERSAADLKAWLATHPPRP